MTRFAVDITKIRTQIVNHIEALNHGQTPQKSVVGFYERFIADIDRRLKENEKNIIAKVNTDKELSETVSRLETIKGVRFLTIVSILAETDGFSMITNRKQAHRPMQGWMSWLSNQAHRIQSIVSQKQVMPG